MDALDALRAEMTSVAAPAHAIHTIAVIGAGEQGRGFALQCARSGFRTVLEDVMPARLRRAQEELSSLSDPEVVHRLQFSLTVENAVRDADLAIDFVPDELESKLEIFSMVDRMAPPRTILCTPTRALSINDLAACTYRADRCLALRADGAELLGSELMLVPGARTAAWVLEEAKRWLEAMHLSVVFGVDKTF